MDGLYLMASSGEEETCASETPLVKSKNEHQDQRKSHPEKGGAVHRPLP